VITAHVRLRGAPLAACGSTAAADCADPQVQPELIAEVDRLLDGTAIARSPTSSTSGAAGLGKRSLQPEEDRLHPHAIAAQPVMSGCAARHVDHSGVAARFGVSKTTVQQWGRQGLITQLYQDELKRASAAAARQTILRAAAEKRLTQLGSFPSPCKSPNEVQYEAVALSRGF